ncbi:YvcK family protein [Candidatus Roizmanbacteria bacterium]|jgi:uncharacterized cofD-like protein|nr:YvcK family protein [Candidatus Roizmanbacteria bacterium]
MKKITVIGGGTGTFVVLTGLKVHPLDLSVIVSMMDSGGSTGRLRDQLGVLPPGDIRQCLLALSEAPLLWRRLFLYRFDSGDFYGHNFGNIFISALEKVSSDYNEVIKNASYILKTKGQVIPVTLEKTHLCAEYEDGQIIKGEANIDSNPEKNQRIKKAFLDPLVDSNPKATAAIRESDYIIIGPGDLYTSIVPVLLTKNIRESLVSSPAKIIYILNLMTKLGQTNNYQAKDHLEDLSRYLGRTPDIVVANDGKIPGDILEWYLSHHEKPVVNNLDSRNFPGKLIIGDVIDTASFKKEKSDKLTRSILRHSPAKLAGLIAHAISL